jgi:hypothetical protein
LEGLLHLRGGRHKSTRTPPAPRRDFGAEARPCISADRDGGGSPSQRWIWSRVSLANRWSRSAKLAMAGLIQTTDSDVVDVA